MVIGFPVWKTGTGFIVTGYGNTGKAAKIRLITV